MKQMQAFLCVCTFLLVLASTTVGEKEASKLNSVLRGEKALWTARNFIREAGKYPFGNGRWDKWEKKDFWCPSPFGSFSDPEDCSKFYICIRGRANHKTCPRNKHFDTLKKTCLSKLVAVCGKSGKTTKAPEMTKTTLSDETFQCPTFMGRFPHPKDCASYYSCMLFQPTQMECPKNQLFDAIKRSCMPAESVHCGNRGRPTTTPGTTITSTKTTTLKTTTKEEDITSTVTEMQTTTEDHQTTTRKTVEPVKVTTQEQVTEQRSTTVSDIPTKSTITTLRTKSEISTQQTTTPLLTETSLSTKQEETTTEIKITKPTGPPETDCDEGDVDCIITETGEVSDWFTCSEAVGSHPHPSSNKLFIFCLNWKPSVKRCGQDLVFSNERLTCIPP